MCAEYRDFRVHYSGLQLSPYMESNPDYMKCVQEHDDRMNNLCKEINDIVDMVEAVINSYNYIISGSNSRDISSFVVFLFTALKDHLSEKHIQVDNKFYGFSLSGNFDNTQEGLIHCSCGEFWPLPKDLYNGKIYNISMSDFFTRINYAYMYVVNDVFLKNSYKEREERILEGVENRIDINPIMEIDI